jgi:hypothetical protein
MFDIYFNWSHFCVALHASTSLGHGGLGIGYWECMVDAVLRCLSGTSPRHWPALPLGDRQMTFDGHI